ncbi:MAG: sulfatase-like hydrolase/transferase [Opitutaceae bacterium]|nr:sulfatase-like hydrolase/transferase [Opitutaceae bacterium]
MLQRVLFIAASLLAATLAAGAATAGVTRPPNVLIVTIDNLGYADLGCFGNTLVRTPAIDALARRGVRCTAFYSASPTCSPSRGSLLTGRYPQRNGLNVQLPGIKGNWGVGLPADEKLIPAYLKPAGYATGCFGKWNVGFAPGTRPTEEGFDEFIGFPPGQIDYFTYKYQGRHSLYRSTEEYHSDKYATDLWADSTIEFIRQNKDRPFFVYLPFNAPHSVDPDNYGPGERVQYKVPDKYLALYGSKPGEDNERIRYFAVISAMDDAFGRVLRALDELNLRENTLVIFYNDNGANTSHEHGLKFASNAPFRGGRPDCWEGGIRVPAIFSWPARLPADTDCDEPLIATDILPMILAAAGVPPPGDRVLDGIDPTPILAGRAAAPDRALFWEYGTRDVHSAVRQGRLKLIRTSRSKPFELYDVVGDPGEWRNIATRHPDVVERLTAAHEKWLVDTSRRDTKP